MPHIADCPLEVARASGQLGPVKLNVIARLPRLGVPRSGYLPLTESAIRTSETPLEEIAGQPTPPDLDTLTAEPTGTADWHIHGPDRLLLVETLHHVAAETRAIHSRKPRDRYSCQVPGCSQRAVEVHHVQF